jgi:Na+-driven multidrug efflux pump
MIYALYIFVFFYFCIGFKTAVTVSKLYYKSDFDKYIKKRTKLLWLYIIIGCFFLILYCVIEKQYK